MKKIVLEKEYSREKTLMYMMMWDVSERAGYQDFLNYDLKNSFYIYDCKIKKTSVWHNPGEIKRVAGFIFSQFKKDKNFVKNIIKRLDDNWKIVFPYLAKKKKIKTAEEFIEYYQAITLWWSAMNIAYPLIENPDISKTAGKTFLKYREHSESYTDTMDKLIREFWQKALGEKYKNLVDYLLIEEAAALLGSRISEGEIKIAVERKKGFCIYRKVVYPADLINSLLKKNCFVLNEAAGKKFKEIKGSSAFHGVVRGVVKKVIAMRDIYDFKKGEILVAEMTSPSHVSIMKKAAAFVTDEGGITCHAAIIAREMKKPCIIGTKIATKVLHDGDLVEVDANKGIVKILK